MWTLTTLPITSIAWKNFISTNHNPASGYPPSLSLLEIRALSLPAAHHIVLCSVLQTLDLIEHLHSWSSCSFLDPSPLLFPASTVFHLIAEDFVAAFIWTTTLHHHQSAINTLNEADPTIWFVLPQSLNTSDHLPLACIPGSTNRHYSRATCSSSRF